MKNTKIMMVITFMTLFLVGCGNKNDNLNKEEVITRSQEQFNDLKAIRQNTEINIMVDTEANQDHQTIDLESEMIYDEDKNIEKIYTKNKTTINDQVQALDFYKDSEGAYSNQGNGWTEHISGESYSSTYEPILKSFLEIANKMEMTENENQYEFNYTGKDGNLFRKAGAPYSMSYQGVSEDEIKLDISYWIDKESMLIHQTEVQTSAQMDENNELKINAKTNFMDFNDVNNIEKPSGIEKN